MNILKEIKKQYPLVSFELVDHKINYRNEGSTFYPNGSPKPEVIKGNFVKISNPMGGIDIVPVTNIEAIHKIALWHQKRSEKEFCNTFS